MAKVMPSQVIAAIQNMVGLPVPGTQNRSWGVDHNAMLAAIVDLIGHVPEELFAACPADDYANLMQAVAIINGMQRPWAAGHHRYAPLIDGKDVIRVIAAVVQKLPDEYPPAEDGTLAFIADAELRGSIRVDVAAAHRANANSEWKASTVLSGASIEALLDWKLRTLPAAALQAAPRYPKRGLNDFGLHDYINVAEDLGILNQKQATAARLAKDFRNLIHPGRAVRLGERCTRSTALQGVAAMEAVIEALS